MAAKKKKATKKVAAKKTTHARGKGTTSKEVLVDGPADDQAEPVSAPAHAPEPMCYSRSKSSKAVKQVSGQSQHMTVAEHQKA